MATPTDIRKGKVILYNNAPHLVLDAQHRTQGRQAGFIQVTMRNLDSGSSTTQKIRSTDSVDILMTDTRRMEFSYIDDMGYHFLDPETFEDTVLDARFVEDSKDFLAEGNLVDILYVDDKPTQVQLPASVEMEVAEAPEAIRGDTSSAALKPVTTTTGLVVQTPLFIKTGERIKVSTADKSYLGRA
jgi:elongation factor P